MIWGKKFESNHFLLEDILAWTVDSGRSLSVGMQIPSVGLSQVKYSEG